MSVENWTTVTLGSICEGIYDGPHATPKKITVGPIYLGISNLSRGRLELSEFEHLSDEDLLKWSRRVRPRAGDIVFSYETRLGTVALIPDNFQCCLGRRMGLLRVNPKKVYADFLLYAYLSPKFQETIRSRTVHGSTVDRISIQELPSFPINIPPLTEQRAIADILSTIDKN
jgi:type I restriction enzyme S subunit